MIITLSAPGPREVARGDQQYVQLQVEVGHRFGGSSRLHCHAAPELSPVVRAHAPRYGACTANEKAAPANRGGRLFGGAGNRRTERALRSIGCPRGNVRPSERDATTAMTPLNHEPPLYEPMRPALLTPMAVPMSSHPKPSAPPIRARVGADAFTCGFACR